MKEMAYGSRPRSRRARRLQARQRAWLQRLAMASCGLVQGPVERLLAPVLDYLMMYSVPFIFRISRPRVLNKESLRSHYYSFEAAVWCANSSAQTNALSWNV